MEATNARRPENSVVCCLACQIKARYGEDTFPNDPDGNNYWEKCDQTLSVLKDSGYVPIYVSECTPALTEVDCELCGRKYDKGECVSLMQLSKVG